MAQIHECRLGRHYSMRKDKLPSLGINYYYMGLYMRFLLMYF